MITLAATVCIDAPVERVWERLARLEDIVLWSDAVLAARITGDIARGVGAERVCDVAGNLTIQERWTEWDEGRSFAYEGVGMPLVRRARNRWSVQREGGQTLLRSDAEVELKGGPWSRPLEPLLALWMRRLAPSSLASFKYLVENGHPYAGKQSELPRVPAAC